MAKAKVVEEREILYPDLEVFICTGEDAITESKAKELLGWETEKDYTARMLKENPKLKAEEAVYGNMYLLEDEEGNKIRCWNNLKNRPYGDGHARALAQDILNCNWAGGITMPGETINGESIIISRTGRTVSGQHRLIGFVIACQIWRGKNKAHWLKLWKKQPVLETLLVVGVSEDPRVMRTLDNVKPRTLSDVFYTSDLFDAMDNKGRIECSAMLGKAVDLLWQRSGAGISGFNHNQTHSESIEFVNRHKKLLSCLHHIFEENKERPLSAMKLSPGQCAAMMYLMGASGSEYEVYHNSEPLSEENINWDNYETSEKFWLALCKGDESVAAVKEALAKLVDPETGTGGRQIEKHCIIAKAWAKYLAGEPIVVDGEEGIFPKYDTDDKGNTKLVDWPDFGGIDMGPVKPQQGDAEPELTPEEIAEAKEQSRIKRAQQLKDNLAKAKAAKAAEGKGATVTEEKPDGSKVAAKPAPKPAPAATPKPAPAPAKPQAGTPPRPKPRPGNASK